MSHEQRIRKLDTCDCCHFCAHSPYIVCAIHPQGVQGQTCLDYRPDPANDPTLSFYEPVEAWVPLGASYYGDDLIVEPVKRLTDEQRLALLDIHPLFTGRCPNCERPMRPSNPRRVHWDCNYCGWIDDSI